MITLVIIGTAGMSTELWNICIIWLKPFDFVTFHFRICWWNEFFISKNTDSIWFLGIKCNFNFTFRWCMWEVKSSLYRNRAGEVVIKFFATSDRCVIGLKPHTASISNTTCMISGTIDDVQIATGASYSEWTQPAFEMVFIHHFVNNIPIFNSCRTGAEPTRSSGQICTSRSADNTSFRINLSQRYSTAFQSRFHRLKMVSIKTY